MRCEWVACEGDTTECRPSFMFESNLEDRRLKRSSDSHCESDCCHILLQCCCISLLSPPCHGITPTALSLSSTLTRPCRVPVHCRHGATVAHEMQPSKAQESFSYRKRGELKLDISCELRVRLKLICESKHHATIQNTTSKRGTAPEEYSTPSQLVSGMGVSAGSSSPPSVSLPYAAAECQTKSDGSFAGAASAEPSNI